MKKISVLLLPCIPFIYAQDLKTSVEELLTTNPFILERLKNYNATKEDITGAKSGFYPKLDLSLGFGVEHTTKGNGVKNTYDFSVYQNSLKLTQNVFNGWQSTYLIQEQEAKTVSSAYSYIETVDDQSFQLVSKYLEVMKNQALLENAKKNVDITQEIFNKVQKLYDSGLTTLSEVNKIESSLALAKSNYVVQENTLENISFNLQKILGRKLNPKMMVKPTLNIAMPANLEEAIEFAMKNNPSLLVSNYNIKLAQATYKEKKSPYYPKIDLEISQSMNKNLSGVEGTDDRFRAMAYVNYNFFNGFSDEANLKKSISQLHQEVQTKNQLKRSVIEGLSLSWAAYEKLTDQLEHLKNYERYSLKTLTLYSKEYDLGRRSLLDLLSAQNDFIGADAQIITTEYNLLFAKYRILDAMGTLVLTVLGDIAPIYSNVGLNGKTPENKDSLPISYDRDKDLIVDSKDICDNSLSQDMKNIYGCKYYDKHIKQIERYGGFLFDGTTSTLNEEATNRLSALIKQLKPYRFENIEFELFGNVDNDSLTEKKAIKLSLERAAAIEEFLIKAGVKKGNITLHANGNEAPLFSNETADAIKLNNRVDIIVKKLIQ